MADRRFCGFCGSPFLPGDTWALDSGGVPRTGWPRKCSSSACGELTWANPTPVAVLLVYIKLREVPREGLFIVQRNIEPSKGAWALPGGFVDMDETWQEACVRELREETTIDAQANEVDLFDVHSVKSNRILIFGLLRTKLYLDSLDAINQGLPNEETQAVDLMRSDDMTMVLAFPTHTAVADKFFKRP